MTLLLQSHRVFSVVQRIVIESLPKNLYLVGAIQNCPDEV